MARKGMRTWTWDQIRELVLHTGPIAMQAELRAAWLGPRRRFDPEEGGR